MSIFKEKHMLRILRIVRLLLMDFQQVLRWLRVRIGEWDDPSITFCSANINVDYCNRYRVER